MNKELRKTQIVEIVSSSKAPVSASSLAKELGVSRQVIVGDVALLRAMGSEIIATARGYIIPEFRDANQYLGKVACRHSSEDTKQELYTIVDLEAVVEDVIVEHDLYGEITGQLNLKCRSDVDIFMERVGTSKDKLLSELTTGLHLHTIACRDKTHFEQTRRALEAAGYLFTE